jgi:hypothetical protein
VKKEDIPELAFNAMAEITTIFNPRPAGLEEPVARPTRENCPGDAEKRYRNDLIGRLVDVRLLDLKQIGWGPEEKTVPDDVDEEERP